MRNGIENRPCRVKIGLGSSGAVAVSSARGPLAKANSKAAAKKNRLRVMTTHFGQVEGVVRAAGKNKGRIAARRDGDRRKARSAAVSGYRSQRSKRLRNPHAT